MQAHRVAVALVVVVCSGCAEGGKPGLSRTKAEIVSGMPHPGDPAVVYLDYGDGGLCTGSLIAPSAVLTARHCVEDPDTGASMPPIAVGTGATVSGGTILANVIDVRAAEGAFEGNDIAVLLLDRAVGMAPYDWVRDAPPAIGAHVIGIGYGDTDTDRGETGIKRRGESTIGSLDASEFTTFGPLSCHGDSGGPGFLDDGRVFGVVSRGTADACSGGSTIYTRTDAHRAFIESAIAGGGADGMPPAPEPMDPGGPGDPPPGDPGPGGLPPGGDLAGCSDLCPWAFDGECDDGGPDADWAVCPYGSDCFDCGPR